MRVSIEGECREIHALVAKIFVPNPQGFRFIRHKNGDKLDNRAENLEWSERISLCKRVGQYLNGELIAEYPSLKDTKTAGFLPANVGKACNGQRTQHLGFQWKYLNNN
jgi:hypothetical protein